MGPEIAHRSILIDKMKGRIHNLLLICTFVLPVLPFALRYLVSGVPFYYMGDVNTYTKFVIQLSNSLLSGIPVWSRVDSAPVINFSIFSFYNLVPAFINVIANNVWFSIKLEAILEIIVAGASMYSLAVYYSKSWLAGVLSAVFYQFTPYFFGEINGHATLMWAYSLAPLVYLFMDQAITSQRPRHILLAGLLFALTTLWVQPIYIFINGMFFVLYLVLRVVSLRPNLLELSKKTLVSVAIIAVSMAVSSYILPSIFLAVWPPSPFELAKVFPKKVIDPTWADSPIEALLLVDKEAIVTFTGYWPWYPSIWAGGGFFTIFLGCLSFLRRKNPFYVNIMMILGISSVAMSVGPLGGFPIAEVYSFFYFHIPYMYTIETPTRFLLTACLAFTLLAGISSERLIHHVSRLASLRKSGSFRKGITAAIAILLLAPVFSTAYYNSNSASFTRTFTTVQLPADIAAVAKTVSSLGTTYQVWDLASAYGSLYTMGTMSRSYWNTLDLLSMYLDKPYFPQLLTMLNVKYIIYDPINTPQILHYIIGSPRIWSGAPYDLYSTIQNSKYFNITLIYPDNSSILNLDPSVFLGGNITLQNIIQYRLTKINTTGSAWFLDIEAEVGVGDGYLQLSSRPLNYSTDTYRELLFKSKVGWLGNAPNTILEIIVMYSDGTSSIGTNSFIGFADTFSSTMVSLDPGKTIREIDLRIIPSGEQTTPQWLHAALSTTQIYLFTNLQAKQEVYLTRGVLALGGPDAYSFYSLGDSSLNWSMVFANQVLSSSSLSHNLLNKYGLFLFDNTDILDLIGLMSNSSNRLDFYTSANGSWTVVNRATGSYPTQSEHLYNGQLTLAKYAILTNNKTGISLDFNAPKSGNYTALIRVLGQPNSQKFDVIVDGVTKYEDINPSNYSGFKFLRLGTLNLSKGLHTIKINTHGSGELVLDTLLMLPTATFQELYQNVSSILHNYKGRYLFISALNGTNPVSFYFPRNSTYYLGLGIQNTIPVQTGHLNPHLGYSLDRVYVIEPPFSSPLGPPWTLNQYFSLPSNYNTVYLTYVVNGPVTIQVDSPYLGIPLVPVTTINRTTTFSLNLTSYMNKPNGNVIAVGVLDTPGNVTNLEEVIVSPIPGSYSNGSFSSIMTLHIGNQNVDVLAALDQNTPDQYVMAGPVNIAEGWHSVSVNTYGMHTAIRLVLSENEPAKSLLATSLGHVQFQCTSASECVANVTESQPVFLVFTESKTNGWSAVTDGETIYPEAAFFFLNSFYINMTGSYTVKISYKYPYNISLYFTYANISLILIVALFDYLNLFCRAGWQNFVARIRRTARRDPWPSERIG